MELYKELGIDLPHGADLQYDCEIGEKIPYDTNNLKPGDLIFCTNKNSSGYLEHVVMYIGNGQTIEEPSTGKMCEIHDLSYLEGWARIDGVKRIFT